jgi:hypothetical protein
VLSITLYMLTRVIFIPVESVRQFVAEKQAETELTKTQLSLALPLLSHAILRIGIPSNQSVDLSVVGKAIYDILLVV